MRTTCQVLLLVGAIAAAPIALHPAAATPPATTQAAPATAATPLSPEIRPSTPEDEALQRLIAQRNSAKGITLSSGPISRPHAVLGKVTVETAAPKDGTETKPGPNLYLNELLRGQAIKLYGEKNVDGIMGITYTPAAKGKLRASGTAVHFDAHADTKGKQ